MHTHPLLIAGRYVAGWVTARRPAATAGHGDRGALSLEWVGIAIILVTAALALGLFLTGKLSALEKEIP